MGKKSLLAPTSGENADSGESPEKKKKPLTASGPAKKAAPKSAKKKPAVAGKKRAAGSKAAKKKAAPKNVSRKKKAPSGNAATAKSSVKPKAKKGVAAGKKPAAKKKPAARRKPVSRKTVAPAGIGELLKRKFDMPVAGKKYAPPPDLTAAGDISSPPYFVGSTEEETQRVRRLLFKKFGPVAGDARGNAGAVVKPSIQKPGAPQKEMASQTREGADAETEAPVPAAVVAPEEKRALDPMQKVAAIGIAVLAVLLIMALWTSASNVGKFYVIPADGQLEIWKGRFSPKGVDKIYTLRHVTMPMDPKAVYGKEEAYGLIFEGVIADADALLGTEGMPDFERIRRTLASAGPFAVSREMSGRLQKRLDKIDMMALVYKADVLAGKGAAEDLVRARESLEKAMDLNLDEAEKGLIQQKINWVDQKLSEAAE